MKLLRFFIDGQECYGYFDGKSEEVQEISIDSFESFSLRPISITEKLFNLVNMDIIEDYFSNSYSIEDIEFLPPTCPSKIVCIGLNYKDHAKELGLELPSQPQIFLKSPSSIIPHNGNILYPRISNRVDYEAELAVVVSKSCKNVSLKDASSYIGGYTILNDVTARDIQVLDEQWTRAKSFDTFAPIGPFIETDMNPLNQDIQLTLNDDIKQNSNTRNMIFSPNELIEFISSVMTLNPGDVISTGTPSGVGAMNKGDTVKITIESIGSLKNFLV
ncbi:MAG: fumarylacetoacetate hydrolase family protein [Methanobrevibacter sp.]|jgi:2-keto-4-pentenoate hydratase/2-oxohepta-3-ene-1,7-dioic acid hydratase in catechol pathway|nr:fumarylacetoacetate hydrolase family protein [Methanobrevibacter sp.]